MKPSVIYLLCVMAIILTACGTSPTVQVPEAGFGSSTIKEPQIGAPYTEIIIQEVGTSNCDGANPTTTVSRSLVQEQTTFFEVAVEAGGLIRGTPIPTVLEAELEAKIKSVLGSNLGNKHEQAISTVLETQPGQARKHRIYWNETKVKGVIDVVYQDGTATLNFEKVIKIELLDRTSEALSCDGNGASAALISTVSSEVPTLSPQTEESPVSTVQPTQAPYDSELMPIREHYPVTVGNGIFEKGTFSDGLALYTEDWLWDNNHFKIQRIRQEEYPSGCDTARYDTNLVWISGSSGMQFTVNDEVVGTYQIADDPHGYILEYPIHMGDKLCAVNFKAIGFSIILGPDIYYHYDSYCHRGNC